MGLRAKRVLLRVGLHSGVLAVLLMGALAGAATESTGAAGLCGLGFLAYLATLRVSPFPGLLERQLLRETYCPYCGQSIGLLDTWSCGCGYATWEPRHAFSPCPECRREFRWLQCPRCDGGIQV